MLCHNTSKLPLQFLFRVLVVEDDTNYLRRLEWILCSFGYQVVEFRNAASALVALRQKKHKFDIVLCGVPMSNIDASFKLVQAAELDFGIPVVVMASNPSDEVAFRGILSGASQCVARPVVDPQTLKDIWQHVVRKRRKEFFGTLYNSQIQRQINISSSKVSSEIGREAIAAAAHGGGGPSCSYNPKEEGGEGSDHDHNQDQYIPKKPRFVWENEYHRIFLDAINSITPPEKIVPMRIMVYMRSRGVRNITREIVASHLQKYRLYLKKYKNNNEADQTPTFLDETNELSLVISCPSDQTLAIQKISSGPSSPPDLPSQNLTEQEQAAVTPPNQPNNDIAIHPSNEDNFLDQNMLDINWDDLDFEALKNPVWLMEDSQPELEPSEQEEEKIFSSNVSNQGFDDNGNIIVSNPLASNSSPDLSNDDLLSEFLHIDNEAYSFKNLQATD